LTLDRNTEGSGLKSRRILFAESMAVDEKYRNQGIGRCLLD
jgi:GNAT superfamily N-acetyltransferase